MAGVRAIGSAADCDAALRDAGKAVLFFWASWSAPCGHMAGVVDALAAAHPGVAFLKVEAEEVDAVTERFGVTTVPYFVLLQAGKECDRLEGADAPGLTERVSRLAGAGAPAPPSAPPAAPPAPAPPAPPVDVRRRIEGLLSSPLVLFLKGSAAAPYCGFSRRVVEALSGAGAAPGSYVDVDILRDEELRQALKEYSNWPTYPQLYVGGELVGGCDIVGEMAASGELKALLQEKAPASLAPPPKQAPPPPAAPAPLSASERARLVGLTQQAPVMLFMKGTPEAPRCGFSRKVAEALTSAGVGFGSFDILTDEGVRQGLKQLSEWPTYPQVYVRGELLGGCDIVLDMAAGGELKGNVEEMLHRMQDTS
ncbi:glrx3 [Scenedesmus sp. PABB004]|nr:glrx3 [Scenedesmus sp. PABB004]